MLGQVPEHRRNRATIQQALAWLISAWFPHWIGIWDGKLQLFQATTREVSHRRTEVVQIIAERRDTNTTAGAQQPSDDTIGGAVDTGGVVGGEW
jgi:hypothetical protein